MIKIEHSNSNHLKIGYTLQDKMVLRADGKSKVFNRYEVSAFQQWLNKNTSRLKSEYPNEDIDGYMEFAEKQYNEELKNRKPIVKDKNEQRRK